MKGIPSESKNIRYGIFILLLCFLVYGNSISNGYSLDDHLVNDQNPLMQKGISGFREILTSFSFKEKQFNYEYRPVMLLTFALEYSAFGVNPHTSHIISILLFSLFSFLLFYFLRSFFQSVSPLILFSGIVLFIVHPIHTEVVDNIKSRDELLVGIFGISMLISFLKYLNSKKIVNLISVIIFLVLGSLSKESIIIYAVLIPFIFLIRTVEEGGRVIKVIAPTVFVLIILIALKMIKARILPVETFSREMQYYENPLYFSGIAERVPAGFAISLVYLKLLCWPFELSYYYGFNQVPISTWLEIAPYIGIIFYLLLVYLAAKYFKSDKFLAFCFLIIFINLIAISGIFKIIPGIVGERFLFFGSAGFCLALVALLFKLFHRIKWLTLEKGYFKLKIPVTVLFCLIFLILGATSYTRNPVWQSEFSLVLNDVKHLENSAKVNDMASYQLLGKLRANPNSPERTEILIDAEKYGLRCVEIYPSYIQCLNNLGTIYYIQRRFPEAEKYYLKGLAIDSSDANVLFNLATIYEAEKDFPKAMLFYKKALSKDPEMPNLIPLYKQLVLKNHLQVDAIVFITDILTIFPNSYNLHLLIIDLYNDQHDYNSALNYLDKAYKLKPSDELAKFIETLKKINSK